MGTKIEVYSKYRNFLLTDFPKKKVISKDYPRLMKDNCERIFFMISSGKGICLNNHLESYNGIQNLNQNMLEDFDDILEIKNQH